MIRTIAATVTFMILIGMVGEQMGYIQTILFLVCFDLISGQFWKGLAIWSSPKVEKTEQ